MHAKKEKKQRACNRSKLLCNIWLLPLKIRDSICNGTHHIFHCVSLNWPSMETEVGQSDSELQKKKKCSLFSISLQHDIFVRVQAKTHKLEYKHQNVMDSFDFNEEKELGKKNAHFKVLKVKIPSKYFQLGNNRQHFCYQNDVVYYTARII